MYKNLSVLYQLSPSKSLIICFLLSFCIKGIYVNPLFFINLNSYSCGPTFLTHIKWQCPNHNISHYTCVVWHPPSHKTKLDFKLKRMVQVHCGHTRVSCPSIGPTNALTNFFQYIYI